MTVTRTTRPAVTVHTFTAGEDGWRSNSHLIELATRVILVDAPLLTADAERVRAALAEIGKPLDRVIITHPHPDHFATAASFDAPVHALAAVQHAVNTAGERQVAAAYALSGLTNAPPVPTISHTVTEGGEMIDEVAFHYHQVDDAEASAQLVLTLPEQSLVFTGDLVYVRVHPFLAARQLQSWRSALDHLEISSSTTILPGHGQPTSDTSQLATMTGYLRTAAEALTKAKTAEQLSAMLDAEYPDYTGHSMRALQNYFLFPPARP